jgi:hypothetical protein
LGLDGECLHSGSIEHSKLAACYLTGEITCVFLVGARRSRYSFFSGTGTRLKEENTVNEPADFSFKYTVDNSCLGAGRLARQFVEEDAAR